MPITVLTIDDDPGITELLAVILKVHNFEVLTANSGEIGVQLIKQKSPSVVILDMMMPDMDGWQVCKAVRDFSNVPILILSALDDPTIVASVLDSGADDYLTKPVTSAVLVAHINKLVRRTGALREKTTGGLTMRTSTS
jgi:two-component system KDP operon response regulator KdpE